LQEAILSDSEAEICYAEFSQSADSKKQGRRAESRRIVSPYQLVWDGCYYWIICRSAGLDKVCRFRTDRILSVTVLQSKRQSLSDDEEQELRRLKSGVLQSDAPSEELRIRFDNSLIEDVMDRFGEKTAVRQESPETFYADVNVQLTEDFWGWLFGLGEKAKILSPEYAAESARSRLEKIEKLYE
jgi:predicted DNA-binding transcriptional regulator YafY